MDANSKIKVAIPAVGQQNLMTSTFDDLKEREIKNLENKTSSISKNRKVKKLDSLQKTHNFQDLIQIQHFMAKEQTTNPRNLKSFRPNIRQQIMAKQDPPFKAS